MMVNGNTENIKHINVVHCNKGNSLFENSIDKVSYILDKYSPDILHIAESNVTPSYIDNYSLFPGYNMELSGMYYEIGTSRNIILIRDRIPYIRRLDLEDKNISTIWVELTLGGGKKLLFMGGYRQW